jgi:U3 small nucleolar RNA-associated protein 25
LSSSGEEEDQFEGFDDNSDSDGDDQMQDEDIASEPSSEDEEEASTERPYNSLLQLLNANSDQSHGRKRRKLDHNAGNDSNYEVNMEEETGDQDVLENQEASDEEDAAEDGKAESDEEDEDDEDGQYKTFTL